TENIRMRNMGRKLSQFRDAGAMLETFDALRKKYHDDLKNHTLASIRTGLVKRKERDEKKAKIEQTLTTLARSLDNSKKRVKNWPLTAGGFDAIAPGLEATFRQGRKAFGRAQHNP